MDYSFLIGLSPLILFAIYTIVQTIRIMRGHKLELITAFKKIGRLHKLGIIVFAVFGVVVFPLFGSWIIATKHTSDGIIIAFSGILLIIFVLLDLDGEMIKPWWEIDDISSRSGIPKKKLLDMPSPEFEILRQKYNYK